MFSTLNFGNRGHCTFTCKRQIFILVLSSEILDYEKSILIRCPIVNVSQQCCPCYPHLLFVCLLWVSLESVEILWKHWIPFEHRKLDVNWSHINSSLQVVDTWGFVCPISYFRPSLIVSSCFSMTQLHHNDKFCEIASGNSRMFVLP